MTEADEARAGLVEELAKLAAGGHTGARRWLEREGRTMTTIWKCEADGGMTMRHGEDLPVEDPTAAEVARSLQVDRLDVTERVVDLDRLLRAGAHLRWAWLRWEIVALLSEHARGQLFVCDELDEAAKEKFREQRQRAVREAAMVELRLDRAPVT